MRFTALKFWRHRALALAGAALFGQLAARADPPAVDVWIDTDPSIGLAFHDADDGFALVQAFHSRELHLRGISATYGNTTVGNSLEIAARLADSFGSPAGVTRRDVFAGAASAQTLGQPTAATAALQKSLAQGRLTYIALGPLTDLATFIKCHPASVERIDRVIFIGGRLPGEHFRLGERLPYEFHDANFEKDVPAAMAVLASRLPITLVPVALSKHILLTADDLQRIGNEGGPAGRYLEENTRLWLRLWRWLFGLDGGPIFDSLAVLDAARPEHFTTGEVSAGVSAEIDRYAPARPGETAYLLVLPPGQARPVTYCESADPGIKASILEDLLRGR